jgi:hypothetical protein
MKNRIISLLLSLLLIPAISMATTWSTIGSMHAVRFTSTDASWDIPNGVTGFYYVLVGGGASGSKGNPNGCGGGGGQVRVGYFPVTSGATTLAITIGAGGAVSTTSSGNAGVNSSISDGTLTITALKGEAATTSGGAGGGGGGGSAGGAGGGDGGSTGVVGADCPGYGIGGQSSGADAGGGGGSYGAGGKGDQASNGVSAAANTGAGGGGTLTGTNSGAGGSGYCILMWVGVAQ